MRVLTVMLAGGKGTRMNAGLNKILLSVCGKSVIRRSVEAFSGLTDEMVIVCHPDDDLSVRNELRSLSVSFPFHFVAGGDSRQASVRNGILSLTITPEDIVLVHDAARCLVSEEIISNVISSAKKYGSGVPGIPVSSTYKICDNNGYVVTTPDRSSLFEIQTPQGFIGKDFAFISFKAREDGFMGTDDASLFEHYGYPVRIVPGSRKNIKLTTPDDLLSASVILKGDYTSMRIGMGYDVHRFAEGRKLILCGVEIPWTVGLLGHSDADVALHALMDAMLGACALGDIGRHFPDTDEKYKGISSLILLKQTDELIRSAGYHISNADITIVAQKPKLASFIPLMTEQIAKALRIEESSVNIKATTTEKLGFEGREEGISAYAICAVESLSSSATGL